MVSLGSSCSSAQAPTEGKPEKIRWSASVGDMWELPLLGLSDDKKFMREAIDVGAAYADYVTKVWMKPGLDPVNHKKCSD